MESIRMGQGRQQLSSEHPPERHEGNRELREKDADGLGSEGPHQALEIDECHEDCGEVKGYGRGLGTAECRDDWVTGSGVAVIGW